jgi:poly(A) polymerase
MTALPGLEDGKLKNLNLLRRGPLAKALAALNGDGEETRLVGGAVRDLALGAPADDFDLATTATPDVVIRRAQAAGLKVALTGVDHGTVTVIVDGRPIETTTLREDVETDGRRATVAFGRDFVADARRRDFTINALSLDAEGRIHDPLSGLEDLAKSRVRFIGDAEARIREDYLRILRFFRFSARFGGDVDLEGLAAAIRRREGLARLSRERVRAELLKLIVAPYAAAVVRTMASAGFVEPIFEAAGYPARLTRVIAIEAARGVTPDAILRLAALSVVIREDAERLRRRLRLSNAEERRLADASSALVELHGLDGAPKLHTLRALAFSHGRQAARDGLELAQAESRAAPDDLGFAEADRLLAEMAPPKLPVGGADLARRGVEKGPRVGAILRAFEGRWKRAGFPEEREALERLLTEAIEESPIEPPREHE